MEVTRQQNKSKGWVFTLNNPTVDDVNLLLNVEKETTYLIYGIETGIQGTLHWQGFCRFNFTTGLARCRQLLPRAHWEVQRGTTKQAIDYCKKDGKFFEWGEPPLSAGDKTKQVWSNIIAAAERGDIEYIKQEQPGIYFRYHERIISMRVRNPGILPGDSLPHEWWYGPTGTGKSRAVWDLYPDHYQKDLNKWWDGYDGQDVVVIEEWAPKNECTASYLKKWADRYPFSGQIKGGTLQKIRPRKIIVTSNWTIEECFPDEQDQEPLKRRFTVKYFPTMFRPVFVNTPDPDFHF